jgi:hypothetical protein
MLVCDETNRTAVLLLGRNARANQRRAALGSVLVVPVRRQSPLVLRVRARSLASRSSSPSWAPRRPGVAMKTTRPGAECPASPESWPQLPWLSEHSCPPPLDCKLEHTDSPQHRTHTPDAKRRAAASSTPAWAARCTRTTTASCDKTGTLPLPRARLFLKRHQVIINGVAPRS